MATLWKRASQEQYHMLRAVAGAVRNTAHAHGAELPHNFDRSVAKRAVGTISAIAAPGSLARVKPPRQEGADGILRPSSSRDSNPSKGARPGDHLKARRWSPLYHVWKDITRKMWTITDPGERRAYVDVLRMLAREQEKLK